MRIALCLLIVTVAFVGISECFKEHLPVIGGAITGGSLGALWDKKYGEANSTKAGFLKKHKGALIGSVVGIVSGKLGEKAVRKLYGGKDESHGGQHGGQHGTPNGGPLCAHDLAPHAPKPALQNLNSLKDMQNENQHGRQFEWVHDGQCNGGDQWKFSQ